MRRMGLTCVAMVVVISGCAGKTSSLLLERRVRGLLAEEALVGQPVSWRLEPVMQTQTQRQIEINVHYASQEYLNNFFGNRAAFGTFAGKSPFFPQHLDLDLALRLRLH